MDIHADGSGALGGIIGFAQVVAARQNVVVPVDTNRVLERRAMLHQDAGELGVHEFPAPMRHHGCAGNVVVMPFAVTAPATEAAAAALR